MVNEREHEMLQLIHNYRQLTGHQLLRLMYPKFPSQQTVNRALRRLLDKLKMVKFRQLPRDSRRLYYLTEIGLSVIDDAVDGQTDLYPKQVTNPDVKDPYFFNHFVSLNDFRIGMLLATRKAQINLVGYIPEYFGEMKNGNIVTYVRDVVADGNGEFYHIPDSVFCIGKDGKKALFYVEIDKGTEVIDNVNRGVSLMLRFYLKTAQQKRHTKYNHIFGGQFISFRVLIVTKNQLRVDRIITKISKGNLLGGFAKYVWLTTEDRVGDILGRIWKPLDPNDKNYYSIAG